MRSGSTTIYSFVCLLISSIAYSDQRAAAQNTLSIAVGEFPPYISHSMEHYGLMPELVSETLLELGYEVHYEFHPWARVKQLLTEGKVDGSISWESSESFGPGVLFSRYYIVGQNVFFSLKGAGFQWKTFEDLKDYRIGVNLGYEFGPVYEQRRSELNILNIPEGKSGLGMLLHNRIDAYLNDQLVVQFEAQTFYPNQISRFEPSQTFHAYKYHLLNLSPARPDRFVIMQKFEQAIADRLSSGQSLSKKRVWQFEIEED